MPAKLTYREDSEDVVSEMEKRPVSNQGKNPVDLHLLLSYT